MQDEEIVALYWQRRETAISETEQKYGRYLLKIANNILGSREDSRESVNDTYLKAWESMPPHRPAVLSTYLGKITRQLSIDIFRTKNRKKRGNSEYVLSLCELEECVPGRETPEEQADLQLLAGAIGAYLAALPKEARCCFIGRYYYMDSLRKVAACCHISESKAKSLLYRTRQGLKKHLEQEGFGL